MNEQKCGDILTGLFGEVTLRCGLPAGHHGMHEDDQLGPVFTWTDNSYRFLGATA